MAFKIKRYGWRPDHGDPRDKVWKAPAPVVRALPPAFDLADKFKNIEIFDQLDLGSCTANATAGQVWSVDVTQPYKPSRLFIYYCSRQLEGTQAYDSGASIRDSIKSVVRYGYPDEKDWAYDISKFSKRPPASVFNTARKERALTYARVNQLEGQVKACIASGNSVNLGFNVYPSFESDEVATTGIVPMPGANEEIIGGHAVLLISYDDATQMFGCRNSWGQNWGLAGHFKIPYSYILNKDLASDFWTITSVQ